MKKVTYRGVQYEVPDYTNFIAADSNGEVWAYQNKPECDEEGGVYRARGGCSQVGHLNHYGVEAV